MAETSARLGLPMLQAGQGQKEIVHNEALALIDLSVQASVVAVGLDEPPATPELGQSWIIGSAPTGAWTGQAGALAGWTAGGWRFVAARTGMAAWVAGTGTMVRRVGSSWVDGEVVGRRVVIGGKQVVGARAPAIAPPTGGTLVDAEMREVIGQILASLRAHGLIEA